MAYEVDLDGIVFQARYFSIDEESLIFKDTQMMCADITGFSYGAAITRVNGIEVKTEYSFRFIDTAGDTISFDFANPHDMNMRGSDVNERMVAEIWAAFGNRLFNEMVSTITAGKTATVGEIGFSRGGVQLKYRPFFGKAREVLVPWDEMDVELNAGVLVLRDGREPKVVSTLGLISTYNTHLVLRIFEQIGGDPAFLPFLTGQR